MDFLGLFQKTFSLAPKSFLRLIQISPRKLTEFLKFSNKTYFGLQKSTENIVIDRLTVDNRTKSTFLIEELVQSHPNYQTNYQTAPKTKRVRPVKSVVSKFLCYDH